MFGRHITIHNYRSQSKNLKSFGKNTLAHPYYTSVPPIKFYLNEYSLRYIDLICFA